VALFENTTRAMQGVPKVIQQRHIDHCAKADKAYGKGVANAIEALDADRVKPRAPASANRASR
jgi:catalase